MARAMTKGTKKKSGDKNAKALARSVERERRARLRLAEREARAGFSASISGARTAIGSHLTDARRGCGARSTPEQCAAVIAALPLQVGASIEPILASHQALARARQEQALFGRAPAAPRARWARKQTRAEMLGEVEYDIRLRRPDLLAYFARVGSRIPGDTAEQIRERFYEIAAENENDAIAALSDAGRAGAQQAIAEAQAAWAAQAAAAPPVSVPPSSFGAVASQGAGAFSDLLPRLPASVSPASAPASSFAFGANAPPPASAPASSFAFGANAPPPASAPASSFALAPVTRPAPKTRHSPPTFAQISRADILSPNWTSPDPRQAPLLALATPPPALAPAPPPPEAFSVPQRRGGGGWDAPAQIDFFAPQPIQASLGDYARGRR